MAPRSREDVPLPDWLEVTREYDDDHEATVAALVAILGRPIPSATRPPSEGQGPDNSAANSKGGACHETRPEPPRRAAPAREAMSSSRDVPTDGRSTSVRTRAPRAPISSTPDNEQAPIRG